MPLTRFLRNWSITWGRGWELRIWRDSRRPRIDLIRWPWGFRRKAVLYLGSF